MTKVFIRHKVRDYAKWKKTFDGFLAQRKVGGELSYSIGHVPNEPNNLCLIFDWDSVDNANAFLLSEELRAAMKESTVAELPDIFISETIEEGAT
jgi:hypothetical protein